MTKAYKVPRRSYREGVDMRGLKTSLIVAKDGKSAYLKIWSIRKAIDTKRIDEALAVCLLNIYEMKKLSPLTMGVDNINLSAHAQLAIDTQRDS